jgi:hypothetical protein
MIDEYKKKHPDQPVYVCKWVNAQDIKIFTDEFIKRAVGPQAILDVLCSILFDLVINTLFSSTFKKKFHTVKKMFLVREVLQKRVWPSIQKELSKREKPELISVLPLRDKKYTPRCKIPTIVVTQLSIVPAIDEVLSVSAGSATDMEIAREQYSTGEASPSSISAGSDMELEAIGTETSLTLLGPSRSIPGDMLLEIFRYLNCTDLLALNHTCKGQNLRDSLSLIWQEWEKVVFEGLIVPVTTSSWWYQIPENKDSPTGRFSSKTQSEFCGPSGFRDYLSKQLHVHSFSGTAAALEERQTQNFNPMLFSIEQTGLNLQGDLQKEFLNFGFRINSTIFVEVTAICKIDTLSLYVMRMEGNRITHRIAFDTRESTTYQVDYSDEGDILRSTAFWNGDLQNFRPFRGRAGFYVCGGKIGFLRKFEHPGENREWETTGLCVKLKEGDAVCVPAIGRNSGSFRVTKISRTPPISVPLNEAALDLRRWERLALRPANQ